jgi:hypothetical protein
MNWSLSKTVKPFSGQHPHNDPIFLVGCNFHIATLETKHPAHKPIGNKWIQTVIGSFRPLFIRAFISFNLVTSQRLYLIED